MHVKEVIHDVNVIGLMWLKKKKKKLTICCCCFLSKFRAEPAFFFFFFKEYFIVSTHTQTHTCIFHGFSLVCVKKELRNWSNKGARRGVGEERSTLTPGGWHAPLAPQWCVNVGCWRLWNSALSTATEVWALTEFITTPSRTGGCPRPRPSPHRPPCRHAFFRLGPTTSDSNEIIDATKTI